MHKNVRAISIIIPARNEGERVKRTLSSSVAGRSCRFPLEIVVVDDASSDGCCLGLSQAIDGNPEVTLSVRRLEHWSGIPYARNRGAELAANPIYLMTDANTIFPRNWDLPIWDHCRPGRLLAGAIADIASSFCGYGCCLTLPSMGVLWLSLPGIYGGQVPITTCACTVIERSLFHGLGGYDESLPLYGAAESEFSVRAWLSGCEIMNVPELRLRHRFRPKPEREAFQRANRRVLARNYLRFASYYLSDELLKGSWAHYASVMREEFPAIEAELAAGGAWQRRDQLRRALPLDFAWFAKKFSLASLSRKA